MKRKSGKAEPDPGGDPLSQLLERALESRRQLSLDRHQTIAEHISAAHVEVDGRRFVNFSSNDYLGLSRHPAIIDAMTAAARKYGAGATASPLICGRTPAHASAEALLAKWKGAEAAVLLPSGYQANHAAIGAIAAAAEAADSRVRFLFDKLCHASLIDAVRATGAPFRVFGHNDLTKLKRLLADADANDLQVVVTESIFSMDGDAAPLAEIAQMKRERPFTLVLDEAHGSGVYGRDGAGYASELGLSDAVDVSIVTLSKAMGCAGGAICASRLFCDGVINFGRAYIYSTAIAPALAAGCEAAIGVMNREPQRQQRVRELARRVRSAFSMEGDSPIVPIILGDEPAALRAAAKLKEQGMLVVAVRPPTVAKGSSRLRVTLSSEHRDLEIERLIDSMR